MGSCGCNWRFPGDLECAYMCLLAISGSSFVTYGLFFIIGLQEFICILDLSPTSSTCVGNNNFSHWWLDFCFLK